jgi:DNA-directed RNA polymerase alpha subunit
MTECAARWRAHGLSARASNCLALIGCCTLAELHEAGPSKVFAIPNLGKKTANEIAVVAGWDLARVDDELSKAKRADYHSRRHITP